MSMDSQGQTIGAIVKGLLVLAALAVICTVALSAVINFVSGSIAALLSTLSTLDVAIVVALITGCVSIVTVIGGGIANNYLAYRQRKGEYLREHRVQAYEKLIEIVYKMLMKSKKKEQYGADEMLSDMNDFNQSLTLWGLPRLFVYGTNGGWQPSESSRLPPSFSLLWRKCSSNYDGIWGRAEA